jgi:protease II
MGQYKVNSLNSKSFILTIENTKIGELNYTEWYSFKAEIKLADNSIYQLEPKGFWDSKIELKKAEKTLLEFKMGWKGIVIKTNFNENEKNYLLKLKGLLSNKFILIDAEENEILAVDTDFKWNKFNFDYTIETSTEFDTMENKELMLLTILHCVNYYLTIIVAVT